MSIRIVSLVALAIALLYPPFVLAHCDGMDGPVVRAAQSALSSGDVNLVLIWVQKEDEKAVKQAFDHTLAVRKLSAEAKELADMYFFETLVRIHRAGEGAAYTGLKPAGRDLGPAIPLADQALSTGKIDALVKFITDETQKGLVERFEPAAKARTFSSADIQAGRDYVQNYVSFIHYVERAHEVVSQPVTDHLADKSHAENEHDK